MILLLRLAIILFLCYLCSTYEHEFSQQFKTVTDNGTITILSNGVPFVDQLAPLGNNYYSYNLSLSNDSLLTLVVSPSSAAHLQVMGTRGAQPTTSSYTKAAYHSNNTWTLYIPLPSPYVWYFLVASSDSTPVNFSITATSLVVCPNNCSGNGICGEQGICSCQPNWLLADCSLHFTSIETPDTITSIAFDDSWSYLNISSASAIIPGQTLSVNFLIVSAPVIIIVGIGYMPTPFQYSLQYSIDQPTSATSPLIQLPNPFASLPLIFTVQSAKGTANFTASFSVDFLCPNDCSGNGDCTASGCVCDLPYITDDCSIYDEELLNNVTTSLDLMNGTWAYFHIVVTDANQIIFNVQYGALNDSQSLQKGVASRGRLSSGISRIRKFSSSLSSSMMLGEDHPIVENVTLMIYARAGAQPTALKYTYTSYGSGPQLRLTINLPPLTSGVATWWLGVVANGGNASLNVTGVSLRECANDCSGNGLCQSGTCVCQPPFVLSDCSGVDMILYSDQPASGHVLADQLVFYHVTVMGDDALFVTLDVTDGGEGDVILLLRKNGYPTSVTFDYRNASQSTTVELLVPSTMAEGLWFIGVLGSPRLGTQYQSAEFHILATVGCKAYNSCSSCIQDPNCGWCVRNGLTEAYGVCTTGSATGPAFSACQAWLFESCSATANQKKTHYLGLVVGTMIGGISIGAILIFGFVFYLQWHHQYKLAYRPQAATVVSSSNPQAIH